MAALLLLICLCLQAVFAQETPYTRKSHPDQPKCSNGKINGEVWDELRDEGAYGFRKQCILDPISGYSVKVLGCIAQDGTFIQRGTNKTEIRGDCDLIFACIANGTSTTQYLWNIFCGAETILPRSSSKPTPEGPIQTSKPTENPIPCPHGRKEGEEWTEKNQAGTREFRKKCEDACVVIIGCISQKGTVVKRGGNHVEYFDDNCDLSTSCIAEGNSATRVADSLKCDKNTVIPRTKSSRPITAAPDVITQWLIDDIIEINVALDLPRGNPPYFWKVHKELGKPGTDGPLTTFKLEMVMTECRRARDEDKIVKAGACPALKTADGFKIETVWVQREDLGRTVRYTDVTSKH